MREKMHIDRTVAHVYFKDQFSNKVNGMCDRRRWNVLIEFTET